MGLRRLISDRFGLKDDLWGILVFLLADFVIALDLSAGVALGDERTHGTEAVVGVVGGAVGVGVEGDLQQLVKLWREQLEGVDLILLWCRRLRHLLLAPGAGMLVSWRHCCH